MEEEVHDHRYCEIEKEVEELPLDDVIEIIMKEIEVSLASMLEPERSATLHNDRSTLVNNAENNEDGLRLTAMQILYRKRVAN